MLSFFDEKREHLIWITLVVRLRGGAVLGCFLGLIAVYKSGSEGL